MTEDSKKIDLKRRKFLLTATSLTCAIGVSAIGIPFVSSMLQSEKAKAAGAAVEVNISSIQPGEIKVSEWRGQPVWILNRSDEMIKKLDNKS